MSMGFEKLNNFLSLQEVHEFILVAVMCVLVIFAVGALVKRFTPPEDSK